MVGVRWAAIVAALVALGCGATESISKLEASAGVVGGGLDPSVLGTFRLPSESAEPGMLELLVLRRDLTFHCELLVACDETSCPKSVSVDGTYQQTRDFPNPSRAAGVVLNGRYDDPSSGPQTLSMALRRAAVAGSPRVGLYLVTGTDLSGNASPYFQLSHPVERWCAVAEDCELQGPLDDCAWSCSAALCSCE
jgi:hypothetical protein